MNGLCWLAENEFILLNALGVVSGLLFTGYSRQSKTKIGCSAPPAGPCASVLMANC